MTGEGGEGLETYMVCIRMGEAKLYKEFSKSAFSRKV